MAKLLTTRDIKPERRLTYWEDLISTAYVPLECTHAAAQDFQGSILSYEMPNLEVSIASSRKQKVLRTRRAISSSTDEWIIASIQTSGSGVIFQADRETLLSPGDFAIYDSTRPYSLTFGDDFEQVVLKLPIDQLGHMISGLEDLTAMKISSGTGVGRMLVSLVNLVGDEADQLNLASSAAVAQSVINLLAAGLQSLPACNQAVLPAMAEYHTRRVKQCIDDRLREPGLTVESIAAHLGISPGHLHRIFREQPCSPAQYLWNRRLEACSKELLDSRRAKVTVAEIAFS